jgi:hypothetical protein
VVSTERGRGSALVAAKTPPWLTQNPNAAFKASVSDRPQCRAARALSAWCSNSASSADAAASSASLQNGYSPFESLTPLAQSCSVGCVFIGKGARSSGVRADAGHNLWMQGLPTCLLAAHELLDAQTEPSGYRRVVGDNRRTAGRCDNPKRVPVVGSGSPRDQ